MYISEIRIENFRLFGAADAAFQLHLNPGLTALVGENDAGKTALIDALRFVLGTRDQDSMRLELSDFHQPLIGDRARDILVRLVFSGLTASDRRAFAEYLTYGDTAASETVLILNWVAKRTDTDGAIRRFMPVEWRTSDRADGPLMDAGARFLLQATYLRPLRDAERAMSAGRGSRLSQILQHTKEIKEYGEEFDLATNPTPDPRSLSLLGLGDYANHLIENSHGVEVTRNKLNDQYLRPLSFNGDILNARVRISGNRDDSIRLRQLLEKLEVGLGSITLGELSHLRGLGSNNLLFMAGELLLMSSESDGFPLLLVEEPEAHLHPQRQLRLMSFLQDQAAKPRPDGQSIQIIVTTHSPNLASEVSLDNLTLICAGRGYPMAKGKTKLTNSDYRFLQRFLDVTKANLFFARGVVIVEGDAEAILLPVIARLIGRDFGNYGVSVVNVGGVGLGRYGRIFMRNEPDIDGEINIPISCVTDMDVMPDCAPVILKKINPGDSVPLLPESKRRWRVKSDFLGSALEDKRKQIISRANEQKVKTFVANEWTLEYDLAFFGLKKEVQVASFLSEADDKLNSGKLKPYNVIKNALRELQSFSTTTATKEEICTKIYEPFASSNPISKPTAAQYLAEILEMKIRDGKLSSDHLRAILPPYVVDAIAHVTEAFTSPQTIACIADICTTGASTSTDGSTHA